MAVSTLVTTAAASNANAYVAASVADQYHLDRPQYDTVWEDATVDEKAAAILWATKLLDANFIWNGNPTTSTQVLGWPRSGLLDYNDWSYLNETTIPDRIQWATAELAKQLLSTDRAADSDIETQGITSIKAGSIQLKFKDSVSAKPIPDVVAKLIPLAWGCLRNRQYIELVRA